MGQFQHVTFFNGTQLALCVFGDVLGATVALEMAQMGEFGCLEETGRMHVQVASLY